MVETEIVQGELYRARLRGGSERVYRAGWRLPGGGWAMLLPPHAPLLWVASGELAELRAEGE